MKWSKAFIPTLKENPTEAEVTSHKLMIRSGLIRRLGSGAYSYLPLGLKVLRKVENIIREEMNKNGALEVLLPAIHPAEIWKKTGRFDLLKEILITYKDRSGKVNVFAPTHEEVITDLAATKINSYRDLPTILYQIQTKFRDEPRPRFGVLRSKEFIMKDAYSFDADEKALDVSYKKMLDAYYKIFDKCGIRYVVVAAESGFMGGSVSHEFMAPADCGEDKVLICKKCNYTSAMKEEEKLCPKCGKEVEINQAIELGHVFKLGTKYSEALGATFLDKAGKKRPYIMGCYGIGVNRILAAVIEQNNDKDGIVWPKNIAPYQVLIVEVNSEDSNIRKAGEDVYNSLCKEGIETLLDERSDRAGIKFKDADLIGVPVQIIIGPKNLKENSVEIKIRKDGTRNIVPLKEITTYLKKLK